MNVTGALALTMCTAVLSGCGLFARSVPVHAVVLDVIFLISTAMALVLSLHVLLQRLATAAGVEAPGLVGVESWPRGVPGEPEDEQ